MNRKFCLALAAGLLVLPMARAEPAQLLNEGSFEVPRVPKRLPKAEGGDPTRGGRNPEWRRLNDKVDPKGGRIIIGLSNELARSGRQSLYVEFDKLTAPSRQTTLIGDMVPIQPSQPYRVSIWGRLNKKSPLTIDQRLTFLRLQVDFYQEDKLTQTGESVFRVQPMPGSRKRPPLFTTGRWSEYFATIPSPDDAKYLKLSWSWVSPPQAGETTGVIYFDDAAVVGEPGVEELKEPKIPTDEEANTLPPDPPDPLTTDIPEPEIPGAAAEPEMAVEISDPEAPAPPPPAKK